MLERKSYIVSRQFTKFFIPTIMITMALSMSIVIDGMIVGNVLGPEALAASLFVLLGGLFLSCMNFWNRRAEKYTVFCAKDATAAWKNV